MNGERPIRMTLEGRDNVRIFHEVARALVSNLDIDAVLRAILSKMEEFFGPEQWSLMMLEEDQRELYFALTSGLDDSLDLSDVRIRLGDGVAGRVAETGTKLVVPDVKKDPEWSVFAARYPELGLRSIASFPIRYGDKTYGVLQLHNTRFERLPEGAVTLLTVLCDYTAIALRNADQMRQIHELSITDDCTGLFNARHLYTQLEEQIRVMSDPVVVPMSPHFSLVFLDLDHFKSINDTHGHLVGSRLLAEIGNLIRRVIGPEHLGFRYGGDEFVALLRNTDRKAALELTTRLREALTAESFLNSEGKDIRITGSFGVATYPENGDDIQSIIRAADSMMYKSKADGRNRISQADGRSASEFPVIKVSRH